MIFWLHDILASDGFQTIGMHDILANDSPSQLKSIVDLILVCMLFWRIYQSTKFAKISCKPKYHVLQ